ncbi:MAG: deoxyhypusine synthase family protein [Acidobacteriota bacterium]|nr:deoxyhypusine synthase family protein [Blastocatellia bacterium]MDW8239516.1 deoxyhypusine synthase family protein [Acidobacteriota bacterium]
MMVIRKTKSSKFLTTPTRPLQIDRDRSVAGVLDKMEGISYQGRNLALARHIWKRMLADGALIMMGMSGLLIPAGMRRLVVYLIKNRFIDLLVVTGGNLFHDLHETLGRYHYIGSPDLNDAELRDALVDRTYDTLGSDIEFREAHEWIANFVAQLDVSRPYSTREFLYLLGRELSEIAAEDGVLTAAYKSKIPVYCPSIADSAMGTGLAMSRVERKRELTFDIVQDVEEVAYLAAKSPKTGLVCFGGGSPKDFLEQAYATANMLKLTARGHQYAVQIVTEPPHFGSSAELTLEESQSWGKVAKNAQKVTVFCDGTIAMPILVTALAQSATKEAKNRRRPNFNITRELKVTY